MKQFTRYVAFYIRCGVSLQQHVAANFHEIETVIKSANQNGGFQAGVFELYENDVLIDKTYLPNKVKDWF